MCPSGWSCSNKTWKKPVRAHCAKLQAVHKGDKNDKSTLPLLSPHSLLLDAPTRRLLDYSYTVLSDRQRVQFTSFLRSFMVKRR